MATTNGHGEPKKRLFEWPHVEMSFVVDTDDAIFRSINGTLPAAIKAKNGQIIEYVEREIEGENWQAMVGWILLNLIFQRHFTLLEDGISQEQANAAMKETMGVAIAMSVLGLVHAMIAGLPERSKVTVNHRAIDDAFRICAKAVTDVVESNV